MQHRLTPVLRDLFVWPPQKSQKAALLRRPAPPSPKGGFERPAEHNAGDYAHWPRGTLPDGRRPLSRVRPCGPHNPRYVSCPRQRTTSAVRCGFATLLFPRPPWSSGQSGSHCVARSRFGLPPTRPPRRGSPEAKTKGKTKKDRFRANRKEVVLACPGQGSSVLGPSRPGPSGAPPAATQP